MTQALIRPATEDDLQQMGEITATAYYEVDTRTYQRAGPIPYDAPARPQRPLDPPGRARRCVTDPGGCWVAEVDGEVVGGAVSRVRELMWILASFAVHPEHQGQRHRHPADGRGPAPRPRVPARHVRRQRRPRRRTPLPAGRLRPAPADDAHRAWSTGRAIPVVERVREGTRRRRGPDGLRRPPHARRGAPRRPRAAARPVPAGGDRPHDRLGLCLRRRGRRDSPCWWRPPTGVRRRG